MTAHLTAVRADLLTLPAPRLPDLDQLRARVVLDPHPTPYPDGPPALPAPTGNPDTAGDG